MKQIKFTFGKDGSVKIEPTGFEGGACRDATRPYELGQGLNLQSMPTQEALASPAQEEARHEVHQR